MPASAKARSLGQQAPPLRCSQLRPPLVRLSELIDGLPADATFSAIRRGAGHHDLGRIQWCIGPLDGPAAVTGTDVGHIQDGRIQMIHAFVDQAEG